MQSWLKAEMPDLRISPSQVPASIWLGISVETLTALSTEPRAGSNRAQNTAKNVSDLLFFLRLFIYIFFLFFFGGVAFWVLIIPIWLIQVPGHIAILFGTFLELPKM